MAGSLKQIYMAYYSTGASGLYARIFQASTGYWLDYVDGVFRGAPANPKNPLSESSPSVYYFGEQREVWLNGLYQVYGYDSTNYLFGGGELSILNDREVSQATLLEYVELIKKIEEGNWQLVGNKWIYYDVDGVTPLITFNTKDSVGNPSMVNIFKRERV